jgi:uncharacterized protein YjfI (DUF2170 family)
MNVSLQKEIDISSTKQQQISLIYKNKYKSAPIQIQNKGNQIAYAIVNNFLCYHSEQNNCQEIKQIDFFSLFENLMQKNELTLAKEFLLRFLKGSKNQESNCSL